MEKFGFIYIWHDKKHKRYYVGSHWGYMDDGYICSSKWMKASYKRRPFDFKRRIIKKVYTDRKDLISEEYYYLSMIKSNEFGTKYYNLKLNAGCSMGNTNKKHSEETKLKISEAKRNNPSKYWQGKKRDQSTKEKISHTKLGTVQTIEHKQINSKKIAELWKDPIWREKMLNARKKTKDVSNILFP